MVEGSGSTEGDISESTWKQLLVTRKEPFTGVTEHANLLGEVKRGGDASAESDHGVGRGLRKYDALACMGPECVPKVFTQWKTCHQRGHIWKCWDQADWGRVRPHGPRSWERFALVLSSESSWDLVIKSEPGPGPLGFLPSPRGCSVSFCLP